MLLAQKGAKKITFTACHSGKLKLTFTSPDIISTSPKSFLKSGIDLTVLLLFKIQNCCYSKFTSPIVKSTSPGWLSDTTFFARCPDTCTPAIVISDFLQKKINK